MARSADGGDAHRWPEPRRWLVGGAVMRSDDHLLLVKNRRRDGRVDWSPPGGVIDPGESLRSGLTREVEEETGLRVPSWRGPVYRVQAYAPDMGWHLRVEAHLALVTEGDLVLADPDGIVVAADYVPVGECEGVLASAPAWVREPLLAWLEDPSGSVHHAFRVEGVVGSGPLVVTRVDAEELTGDHPPIEP